MSQVFISYRQTDDEQRQRLRAFGESLRRCGIDVVLDQFFLDDHPAGPDEGWDNGVAIGRSIPNTFSSSALAIGSRALRRPNRQEPRSASPAKPTIYATAFTKQVD